MGIAVGVLLVSFLALFPGEPFDFEFEHGNANAPRRDELFEERETSLSEERKRGRAAAAFGFMTRQSPGGCAQGDT